MIPTVSVIVVDADGGFRKAVRHQINEIPGVALVGEAGNITAAHELLGKTQPNLVLLELPSRPEETLTWVAKWKAEYPGLRVFATSVSKSPESILMAFRSGVSEYLSKPLEVTELRTAIERIVRELEVDAIHSRRAGEVIAVFSKKGGLGVTTLAVNLAVALAANGRQVVIADLAFDLGDVASQLDIQPEIVLTDIVDKRGDVDPGRMQSSVIRHSSGVYFLGEKDAAGATENITPKQLNQMLIHLRESFQSVILDLPHVFDSHTYEALQIADHILLVATCEVSTIRATRYALQIFRSLGYDERKVKIVLNRQSKRDSITEAQFCETVGYPIAFRVPSDYRTVIESVNGGEPLTMVQPKSSVAKSITQVAQDFISPNGSVPFARAVGRES